MVLDDAIHRECEQSLSHRIVKVSANQAGAWAGSPAMLRE